MAAHNQRHGSEEEHGKTLQIGLNLSIFIPQASLIYNVIRRLCCINHKRTVMLYYHYPHRARLDASCQTAALVCMEV